MLKWRLVSSIVIIVGLLVLLFLDHCYPLIFPGMWLLPVAVIISLLMVQELLGLWRDRPDRPIAWPVYAGAALTILAGAAAAGGLGPAAAGDGPMIAIGPLGGSLLGLLIGMLLAFIGELMSYREPGRATGRLGLSLLAIAYAGGLLSLLVALRWMIDPQWGMAAVVSLVIIVKLSDTGAYFTGRSLGRHTMAPLLSPGKTWEGTCGGLAAAAAGAWLCQAVIVPPLVAASSPDSVGSLPNWIAYGLLVALGGMAGDLSESLLKRDVQRKDSSGWLPGLGGVLDIVDSLLFAVVPAYLCWAFGLIGPR